MTQHSTDGAELTLDALTALVRNFPVLPPDVRWEFHRSEFVPDGEVLVCDPNSGFGNRYGDDALGRLIRQKIGRAPYLVLARDELTHEQQLHAVALFLEQTRKVAP